MPTRRAHIEDDEEKIPRRRGSVEEDTPKRSRRSSVDEDDDETPARKSSGKERGWGELARRRAETEEDKEVHIKEFWLKSGESAIIQFVSEEPYCLDGHIIKTKKKAFDFTPCQLNTKRTCIMCREGLKTTWRAVFKILDYRGTWDDKKNKFKNDTTIEKIWIVGEKLAEQIKSFADKKGKDLTEMVIEVTRSGSGKTTTYNLQLALDDETDRPIKPKKVKEEFADVEELMQPLTDEKLVRLGFEEPERYGD